MNRTWLWSGKLMGVVVASMLLGLYSATPAQAQQGKYVSEAAARLVKLINEGNSAGYKLHDNSFSIGGGWLKQGNDNWVSIYTVPLQAGKDYRFLASGDGDATDVDIEVQDPAGRKVAADAKATADAVVNFSCRESGRYLVRIRLFGSRNNLPCVCLSIVLAK